MSVYALLQARTSSSRLPAKVLLPLGGYPVAVLAALRAGNGGIKVKVLTSDRESDDALVRVLSKYNIDVVRGDLDDVLSRFVLATQEANDDDVVIRLTADNVLPDGEMLERLVDYFLNQALDYLCCNGRDSGLPYGASVELMYVRGLREADRNAKTSYQREHVTPYLVGKYGRTYYQGYSGNKKGYLRATIDSLDDYLAMEKLTSGVDDMLAEPMLKLVDQLAAQEPEDYGGGIEKMILGTVQLGVAYGVVNKQGKPTDAESASILKSAITGGVGGIDTARAYGNSEAVIGRALRGGWTFRTKIYSKIAPIPDSYFDAVAIEEYIASSLFQSLFHLQVECLDVLMFHRVSDMRRESSAGLKRAVQLMKDGYFGELGASVQTPEELIWVLGREDVSHVQMPYNLLDSRWEQAIEALITIRDKRKMTIHVRSSLLQGLIASDDTSAWKKAHVHDREIINWLEEMRVKFNRADKIDLALAYVRSMDWIDGVVVGVEKIDQLQQNFKHFGSGLLSSAEVEYIKMCRPKVCEDTLNPARWD